MEIDLQACCSGDAAAWQAFVNRYARVIHAAVRKAVGAGAPERLDDIMQDVFMRLVRDDFRVLRTFDPGRSSLPTWLTLVARSTAIDALRRQRRDRSVALDGHADPVATKDPEPREAAGTLSLPEQILSGRQKLVMHMLFEREMTVPQVAAALAVDEQTVRSTKHKALVRLRAHFDAGSAAAEGCPPANPRTTGGSP